MIEVTVKYLEGLNFIADIKIVEPREKRNGVFIEYVDKKLLREAPEFKHILRAFGMRKTGDCLERGADIYTFYPWGYLQYKVIHLLVKVYWKAIFWLYNNARMFKQIPSGEMFSWSYFTPYTWVKGVLTKGSV